MNKSVEDLADRWLDETQRLGEPETRVLRSTIDRTPLSRDIGEAFQRKLSTGDRLADAIARVGGSWTFILGFLVFLGLWAGLNTVLLAGRAFDPYPFIFLNLVLSMLAALQAPVIMMSQNRQAARDRLDAAHDYEINLKAEIEIMALHEKLDELRHSEILTMRDDIRKIADALAGIEKRAIGGAS